MKQFARDKQIIKLLLMGLLLLPFTLFGQQDEEEETPAEKQSAKESQQSISIVGLDANPSKTLERIEVLRSTGKIDIKTYVEAVRTLDANPSKALERIEVLVSTGKIDNETFAKAIVAIIPNEAKAKAYVEELKASGKVPAAVIDEVFEEITNVEVPPAPPSVLPPTAPPTAPTTPDPEPTDPNITYDKSTDELRFYDKNEGLQIISDYKKDFTKDELEKFEAKLEGLGFYGKSVSEDEVFSQTIPYVIDAFEIGNMGTEHFNDILLEAVNFTSFLIQDLVMSGDVKASDFETNLFDSLKLEGILNSQNPYYFEIVEALAKKGAFGDKDDSAIGNAVLNIIKSLKGKEVNNSNIKSLLNLTLRDIVFNKLNNGDLGGFGEFEGLLNLSEILPDENQASSLFNIKANQVKGIVAQNIILGSKGVDTTNIDLTDQLPKTSTTAPSKPEDWKVFGIGAGKDIIVKGNVSFKNSNNRDPQTDIVLRPQVKDHALAIGALDEIHFHSKTIEADWGLPADFLEKHLDYSSSVQKTDTNDLTIFKDRPDRIKMDFEGANLYLGSISKMELVNVDLESGGNLAVASLDELHIVSSDPENTPNTFTVGKNTNPSDDRGDNVQLFANERIVADGLRFEGRVDSIYMEARTVDLKNVTFPNGSEVNLASRDGGVGVGGKYPTFGIGQRAVGKVNFIDQVKYDTNHINSQNSFDALGKLPNGKHPITISKR